MNGYCTYKDRSEGKSKKSTKSIQKVAFHCVIHPEASRQAVRTRGIAARSTMGVAFQIVKAILPEGVRDTMKRLKPSTCCDNAAQQQTEQELTRTPAPSILSVARSPCKTQFDLECPTRSAWQKGLSSNSLKWINGSCRLDYAFSLSRLPVPTRRSGINRIGGLCRSNPSHQAFCIPLHFRGNQEIMLLLTRSMLAILILACVSLLVGCQEQVETLANQSTAQGTQTSKSQANDSASGDALSSAKQESGKSVIVRLRGLAESGEPDAQRQLGDYYSHLGEAGSMKAARKNDPEALKWYQRSAAQGDAEGLHRLGVMYASGRAINRNDQEAIRLYRLAVEKNNARALNSLGWMYASGHGVTQDDIKAVKLYRQAAARGTRGAQTNLGWMYEEGRGVPKDDKEAVRWYRLAAEQDYPRALVNLGRMHEEGRGVPKDDVEAVRWYRRAAEQGNTSAQFKLGASFAFGRGVPQDATEAVKWFRLAAEQGDPTAQFNLGVAYANGHGISQDDVEAVKWYRSAAEQDFAPAQFKLGASLAFGHGVPQDDTEAVKWLHLAAEQGLASAQHNLAIHYSKGQGVPQDDAEAVKWYHLAAEQGSDQTHLALATIYAFGYSSQPINESKAKYHLRKASETEGALSRFSQNMFEDTVALEQKITTVKQAIRQAEQLGSEVLTQAERDFFAPSDSAMYWDDERRRHVYYDGKNPADMSENISFAAKLSLNALRPRLALLMAQKSQVERVLMWIREMDRESSSLAGSVQTQSDGDAEAADEQHSVGSVSQQATSVFDLEKKLEIDRELKDWSTKAVLVHNDIELPPDVELLAGFSKNRLTVWHEAAEANVPSAQCLLGVCLFYGIDCKEDRTAGAAWLNKAASQVPRSENDKQIYAESQLMLGRAYLHEDNDELDNEVGINALKVAAAFGSKRAFLSLGNYFFASGNLDADAMKEVFSWYKQSAEAGSRVGMLCVASVYEHGRGAPQDHSLAWQWMEKSAKLGNPQAETGLGLYLLEGVGVDVDTTMAAAWMKRAAEKDFALAQFILSGMYLNGIGVQKNSNQFVAWLKKAANNGDPKACEVLAVRYLQFNELSVSEHLELAKGDPLNNAELKYRSQREGMKYLRAAAVNGNTEAESFLKQLQNP